tara:strand:+ start:1013 stop:1405 length:393 start_codon:yes stop_codon:yes gene_type:complete
MIKKTEEQKSSNRSFGIVFFLVFLIVSILPLFNDENIRIWAIIIAIIFLYLGLKNSPILTPLNKIWFKFGILLGTIVSPFIMGIVFFLVVTPTGIFMRLLGKDIIKLKKNNKKSYWIEKSSTKSDMKNQF